MGVQDAASRPARPDPLPVPLRPLLPFIYAGISPMHARTMVRPPSRDARPLQFRGSVRKALTAGE